jgi:hypothetical protein
MTSMMFFSSVDGMVVVVKNAKNGECPNGMSVNLILAGTPKSGHKPPPGGQTD